MVPGVGLYVGEKFGKGGWGEVLVEKEHVVGLGLLLDKFTDSPRVLVTCRLGALGEQLLPSDVRLCLLDSVHDLGSDLVTLDSGDTETEVFEEGNRLVD